MLFAMNNLHGCRVRMKKLAAKLEKKRSKNRVAENDEQRYIFDAAEPVSEQTEYEMCLNDLECVLLELTSAIGRYYSSRFLDLASAIAQAKRLTERDPLLIDLALEQILNSLDKIDILDLSSSSCSSAFMDYSRGGVVSSNLLPVWQFVSPRFEQAGRAITVLEPNCGNGSLMKAFNLGLSSEKYLAYGVNPSPAHKQIARPFYQRMAMGSFVGGTFQNNAFDLVAMVPPLTVSSSDNVLQANIERTNMKQVLTYLRIGGYLCVQIPAYRMIQEVNQFFARYFDSVEIFSAPSEYRGSEHDIMRPLWVIARKHGEKLTKPEPKIMEQLRSAWKDKHPAIDTVTSNWSLPPEKIEITTFRGSVLDEDELREMYKTSGANTEFWSAQRHRYLLSSERSPLLRFNKGQTALVLTSGCLDGLIDEGNGCFHVVKGRIVKNHLTERSNSRDDSGAVTHNETTRTEHRVEIHALLPDGTHKILA